MNLPRRTLSSLYVLTGLTERRARRRGVRPFLPAPFTRRFAQMGGWDVRRFRGQLDEIGSFSDEVWCGRFNALAGACESEADAGDADQAARALRSAMTYFAVSAFPGTTPARIDAYWNSRRVFDRLLVLLGEDWETVTIDTARGAVRGHAWVPPSGDPSPMAIVVHGLEGTAQELVLLLRRYREAGLAFFVMEMPGTYAYERPMSGASAALFDAVIERFASDPRVDPRRIGVVGVSFGGYWAARMAATNRGVACAVADGAPTHRSFGLLAFLGTPQIVLDALMHVTGTTGLLGLGRALGGLSLARLDLYERIAVPLLVINGDSDSLVSSRDSIELAVKAPRGLLRLYAGDDHCAVEHLDESVDLAIRWLRSQLGAAPVGAGARQVRVQTVSSQR